MLIFKPGFLQAFSVYLLLIEDLPRDLTNHLRPGVIAGSSTLADLSEEASQLGNSASSECQRGISTRVHDAETHHIDEQLASPNRLKNANDFTEVEQHGEPKNFSPRESRELLDESTQSSDNPVAPPGERNQITEEMETNTKMKSTSDIHRQIRKDEEEADLVSTPSNPSSSYRSPPAEWFSGKNTSPANSGDATYIHETPTSIGGESDVTSSSSRPINHFGYPTSSHHSPEYSMPAPADYNVANVAIQQPTWEWKWHWLPIAQLRHYYELTHQLVCLPVQKNPNFPPPIASSTLTGAVHYSPSYGGAPASSKSFRNLNPSEENFVSRRKQDPRRKGAQGKWKIKAPNAVVPKNDRSRGKGPEDRMAGSSGVEEASKSSDNKGSENSRKESLTISYPEEKKKQANSQEEVKTILSSPGSALENKNSPKETLREMETTPTKIFTTEANNKNIGLRESTQVDSPKVELHDLSPKKENLGGAADLEKVIKDPQKSQETTKPILENLSIEVSENKHSPQRTLEELVITPKKISTAEASNNPIRISNSLIHELKDSSKTKEDLAGAADLETARTYKQALKSENNPDISKITKSTSYLKRPSALDKNFADSDYSISAPQAVGDFKSNEKIKNLPGHKDLGPNNDPAMEQQSSSELRLRKPNPNSSLIEKSNLKKSSQRNRKKIFMEDTIGTSSFSQPGNKFEFLEGFDQDTDSEAQLKQSGLLKKKKTSVANDMHSSDRSLNLERPLDLERSQVASEAQRVDPSLLDHVRPYLVSTKNLVHNAWNKTPGFKFSVPSLESTKNIIQNVWDKKPRVRAPVPSLDSTKNIVKNMWNKKPGLRVPIPSLKLSLNSAKSLLQSLRVNDFPLPSKNSFFGILQRAKPQLSYREMSTGESSKPVELEVNPSTISQKYAGRINKINIEQDSIEKPLPSYVRDYLQVNPGAKQREIVFTRVLGKFLQVDSKEPLPLIHISAFDKDYETILEYLKQQKNLEEPTGKQVRWLFDKIGEVEGKRRWTAIVRQCSQPVILRKWEEWKANWPDRLSLGTSKLLDRVFRLSEAWPTFYGSTTSSQRLLEELLKKENINSILKYVLGEMEFKSRVERIFAMSTRVYPHNWLSEGDIKSALQQGFDIPRIIRVGDLLQFGRKHFTTGSVGGIPSLINTFEYFIIAWGKRLQETPWGSSPEKAWFLSEPDRAEQYESKMAVVKEALKYASVPNDVLLTLTLNHVNFLGEPWWNVADLFEWYEYQMDPRIMVKIGQKLNIPKSRDMMPNLKKLMEILGKKEFVISNEMKKRIFRWFELNSHSPYKELSSYQEETSFTQDWANLIEDLKSYLQSVRRQKSFLPHSNMDVYTI